MHGAVDDYGRGSIPVTIDDFPNVVGILGVGEALVVDDHIIRRCPFRVVIKIDLRLCSPAPLVNDGPFDVSLGRRGEGESFGLEGVVVTATSGNQETLEHLSRFRRLGGGRLVVRLRGWRISRKSHYEGKGNRNNLGHREIYEVINSTMEACVSHLQKTINLRSHLDELDAIPRHWQRSPEGSSRGTSSEPMPLLRWRRQEPADLPSGEDSPSRGYRGR